jgi:membrane protein YdbS with pleckstrin-like domain
MTTPSDVPPASDPSRERPHKPADDREEVYFHGSPMMRGELGKLLLLWLIAVAIAGAAVYFQPPWYVITGCIVVAIVIALVPWIMTKMHRYRISNYRIDFEHGLLSKRIDTLELWHVEDISFQQSLSDRMLGVGTITIVSHDRTTPRLELKSLPNPRPLFDSLKQRIIAVKRQRGVIKMDVGAHPGDVAVE